MNAEVNKILDEEKSIVIGLDAIGSLIELDLAGRLSCILRVKNGYSDKYSAFVTHETMETICKWYLEKRGIRG